MGSSQSVLSAEGVVTALVVAGAVGVGYTQMKPTKETQQEKKAPVVVNEKETGTEAGGAPAKKNKKKKATTTPRGTADVAGAEAEDASDTPVSSLAGSKVKAKAAKPAPAAASAPPVKGTTKDSIPGGFDTPVVSDAGTPSTSEKKSKKKKGRTSAAPDSNASGVTTPNEPSAKSPPSSSLADSTQSKSTAKASGGKQKQAKAQQPPAKSQQQQAAPSQPPATKSQSQVLDVAAPLSTSSTHGQSQPLDHSFVSIDTDESWTRVGGSKRSKNQTSATSASAKKALPASTSQDSRSFNRYATSTDDMSTTTGNSSPVGENAELEEDVDESFLLRVAEDASRSAGEQRKTLAEKLLPKPRKTAVDDMLETPANPPLARVIRVQSDSSDKLQPAPGFSWGDYEDAEGHIATDGDGERDADAEEDEEGWGVVKSRKPRKTTPSGSTASLGASATSATSAPSSSTQLTKKQMQNKKRREAEKTANAQAEKERLAKLAAHKRQLEVERMKEQQKKGKSKESGGMKAIIDAGGKLVWE